MPTEPLLALRELQIGYGPRPLLPPITLGVRAGEVWALVGPNGSGKTTLVRTILGQIPAVNGERGWSGARPPVGYVPQRTSLDTSIPARVIDVVRNGVETGWSFAVPWHGWQQRGAVADAMRDARVEDLRNQQFSRLSEGQKQRVLMARALACGPKVLILDEPTSAMDFASERRIMDLISELRERRNLAVLLVSHHLHVLAAHSTHALVVDRDQQLVLSGPIDEIARHAEVTKRYGGVFADARVREVTP